MCGIKKGDVAGQKINRTVAVEFHLFFKNSRRESGLRVPTPTAPPTRPSPPSRSTPGVPPSGCNSRRGLGVPPAGLPHISEKPRRTGGAGALPRALRIFTPRMGFFGPRPASQGPARAGASLGRRPQRSDSICPHSTRPRALYTPTES